MTNWGDLPEELRLPVINTCRQYAESLKSSTDGAECYMCRRIKRVSVTSEYRITTLTGNVVHLCNICTGWWLEIDLESYPDSASQIDLIHEGGADDV